MKKWLESHPIVLLLILLITIGCIVTLPTILDPDLLDTNLEPCSPFAINPIITSGNITKTGYAQGVEETSIVEIIEEEFKLFLPPDFISREVIGKTVVGKLVDIEFKETGFFFKKTNVVLTFKDSEDGKKTTVITANCGKQRIWQKGKIQEITIIHGKVESVQIKNYEI